MQILGLSGSLRAGSYNTALLRLAAAQSPAGTAVEIADLSDVPVYNEDVYASGFPPAVERLRGAIRDADALLIATPEYNYSVPGVLKNAIDWASRPPDQPFSDKPLAIMGASPGAMGTGRAQYHLRQVFVFLDCHIVNKPEVMVPGARSVFDDDGKVADTALVERVGALVAALVEWTQRLRR